jgi:hypothetical protein
MVDSELICMWVTKATRTSAGVIGPGPVQVPYATVLELIHSESAHFGDKPWHDSDWQWSKSDCAFRYDDPAGPASFASYKAWWNQGRFARLWTPDADMAADDLTDRYWFAWPWLIGPALVTAAPQTANHIEALAADPDRRGPGSTAADSIATWGSFHVVRRRRTWPGPSTVVCPMCNKEFWNGDLSPWMFKAFGPARYCGDCCKQARSYPTYKSDPPPTPSRQDVIAALIQLSAAFQSIPSQAFSLQILPPDAPDNQRDIWMRALIAMPTADAVKEALEVKDWLGALKAAGLVQSAWRPALGTWCHAADGHLCRSLLEKSIDDWFTSNEIAHQCEPRWPAHPELNPSGRKRADWLLQDGTYVECAGMIEESDYAVKIAHKRELASVLGIPLLIVVPTDLLRLPQIFASQMASGVGNRVGNGHGAGSEGV